MVFYVIEVWLKNTSEPVRDIVKGFGSPPKAGRGSLKRFKKEALMGINKGPRGLG